MPSSRRGDGVRRSERPRHDLYASLNENYLDNACFGATGEKRSRREAPSTRRSSGDGFYMTRSRRVMEDSFIYDDEQSNDEPEDERPSRDRRHSRRSNLVSPRTSERSRLTRSSGGKESVTDDGDENKEPNEEEEEHLSPVKKSRRAPPSPSPELMGKEPNNTHRRRRVDAEDYRDSNSIEDDEEEDAVSTADEPEESNSRGISEEPVDDEDSKDGRRYPIRTTRSATKQQIKNVLRSPRPMRKCREKTAEKRPLAQLRNASSRFKQYQRNVRRRLASSDSDSESDNGRLENSDLFDPAEADMIEALRHERRVAKKSKKQENIFMPMNMTEDDLNGRSKVLTAERLRQAGSTSCTGVDPMVIDRSIGFEHVGGLDTQVQSLKEMVLFPLLYPEVYQQFNVQPPKGVVFYGPPGTGKTLVARALANECSRGDVKVAFFMRKGADCLSKWVGESERQLRHLFSQAYAMRPSIIFFDEIDGLAPVRSSKQDQIHSSIVSTLLALMDGLDSRGEVVVIGATNRLDAIDPALRRPGRFDREMRFSLPDEVARRSILDINVSKWENPPDCEMMNWLAKKTAGFCGADIKSLCSEAVLAAMRSQYPHIYLSNEKLEIDAKAITVSRDSFKNAFTKITPASRRDLTVPSRQITDRQVPILQPVVDKVLEAIPDGFKLSNTLQNRYTDKLERIVRSAEHIPAVPSTKILVGWKDGSERGQTDYVLPIVVNTLDHLTVIPLTPSQLFSQSNPEEALHTAIQSALRTAGSGTACMVLIPALDRLVSSVSCSFESMLQFALRSLDFVSSVLVIASIGCDYQDLKDDLKELFPPSALVTLDDPTCQQREIYFETLISRPAELEPFEFVPENYPKPNVVPRTAAVRKLSGKELENLKKEYENKLLHMRIYFRDCLARLIRDRRFQDFVEPVEEEDAPDYYEIITNPLCLREMMQKIDDNVYKEPEDFIKEIQQIRFNAIEYNPAKTLEGQKIRHSAHALVDMVEGLFEVELKASFVARLKACKQMIEDAEGELEPPTESAKSPDSTVPKTEPESSPRSNGDSADSQSSTSLKRKGSVVENSPKRLCMMSDTDDEITANVQSPKPKLICDHAKLKLIVEKVAIKCKCLSINQLECLADHIENVQDGYRDKWDRTNLPGDIKKAIKSFVISALT
uniref:Bromo domain-containing protein n=1 Tax=Steinernema glaseri TaxID=37863 RepID=A0A1I7YR61_9BILA